MKINISKISKFINKRIFGTPEIIERCSRCTHIKLDNNPKYGTLCVSCYIFKKQTQEEMIKIIYKGYIRRYNAEKKAKQLKGHIVGKGTLSLGFKYYVIPKDLIEILVD